MTQYETVLKHIHKFGSISPRDALMDYNITRLAARIHDLKQMGYEFDVATKKHQETGIHYARYALKKKEASEANVGLGG